MTASDDLANTFNRSTLMLELQRLQNGYAHAIDVRDWDYFRTLFAPDVVADYPNRRYLGIDEWLDDFIPFHADCTWTNHSISTHVAGVDAVGAWGTCHGHIIWEHGREPGILHRVRVLYLDRVRRVGGNWVIAERTLRVVLNEGNIATTGDAVTLAPPIDDLFHSVLRTGARSSGEP